MASKQGNSPLSVLEQIDSVCDRFEAAWKDGLSPRIEEFVGQATGSQRSDLIAALLGVELELRQRQGERPTPDAYCVRFPDQAGPIARVFEQTCRSADSVPVAAQETMTLGPKDKAS